MMDKYVYVGNTCTDRSIISQNQNECTLYLYTPWVAIHVSDLIYIQNNNSLNVIYFILKYSCHQNSVWHVSKKIPLSSLQEK